MCQTTHLKILGLVTFFDLNVTLTWAKYENISLVSVFALSLGVHMESFLAKKATFEVSTVRNLNTPEYDLWADLDLTRDLNFKFSKMLWKRLVEIFRIPHRPSIYDPDMCSTLSESWVDSWVNGFCLSHELIRIHVFKKSAWVKVITWPDSTGGIFRN